MCCNEQVPQPSYPILLLYKCFLCWRVLPINKKNGGNIRSSETSLVSFTLRQSIYPNEEHLSYLFHEQGQRNLLTLSQFWQMKNCSAFTAPYVLCSCRFKIMPSFSPQLPRCRQERSSLCPVLHSGTATQHFNSHWHYISAKGTEVPPLQWIYSCEISLKNTQVTWPCHITP